VIQKGPDNKICCLSQSACIVVQETPKTQGEGVRRANLERTLMPGWLCRGMTADFGKQKMPMETLLSS
jgi:hypothetical protein